MSEIKALEEMRKCYSPSDSSAIRNKMLAFADAIQAEVDERFMELPLDADGVPICVGDTIEDESLSIGPIDAVCFLGNGEWIVYERDNSWVVTGEERHVKPRTLEDVLREFGIWYAYTKGGCDEDTVMSEYAAKIRELLGVSE